MNFNLPQISNFTISGLNNLEKKEFEEDLDFLRNENIISIDKDEVSKKIYSNKIVEDLFIFKKYPSELKILIKKTNFLAITKKNNQNYYIGSNGNFILIKGILENLPFIFGDIEPQEFLKLKLHIDKSKFDFDQIKNLFFFKSKRWNIETKKGLIIKLPLNQIDLSLNILSKIVSEEQFKNKKVIDLRNNGQIITND
ncbi:FtsQ-type POTRA domain-containing protein [Candidatus Pelagibacter sp.]|nr:FtsQ-type POTRA domain-containing protein [Candidatus Pelagibacter sp.]